LNTFGITWTFGGGIARELKSLVEIEIPFTDDVETFWAIWDTGATNSVIHTNVVNKLGLVPTGQGITHGVHGPALVNTYLVNIGLPNPRDDGFTDTLLIDGIQVTESGAMPGCDVLIGMDIIGRGDFSVTNNRGFTMFSFRIPSLHHIDYKSAHNGLRVSPTITGPNMVQPLQKKSLIKADQKKRPNGKPNNRR
jgi:hypothetical protein